MYIDLEYDIGLGIRRLYTRWLKPFKFKIYYAHIKEGRNNCITLKTYKLYIPFYVAKELCELILFIEIYKKYIPFRKKGLEDILPSSKVNNIILTYNDCIAAQSFIWDENKIASEFLVNIT